MIDGSWDTVVSNFFTSIAVVASKDNPCETNREAGLGPGSVGSSPECGHQRPLRPLVKSQNACEHETKGSNPKKNIEYLKSLSTRKEIPSECGMEASCCIEGIGREESRSDRAGSESKRRHRSFECRRNVPRPSPGLSGLRAFAEYHYCSTCGNPHKIRRRKFVVVDGDEGRRPVRQQQPRRHGIADLRVFEPPPPPVVEWQRRRELRDRRCRCGNPSRDTNSRHSTANAQQDFSDLRIDIHDVVHVKEVGPYVLLAGIKGRISGAHIKQRPFPLEDLETVAVESNCDEVRR